MRRAFDLGVTHFDLANNYGPPYGSAEENFGRIMRDDLRPYRDELVISTKAGYDMWPGPYGDGGSRKYLLASLDQSLARLGLDYVDIFYSHRVDPSTPLEETMGALDSAVRQGKALYVGISSYSAEKTREAHAILRELGTPLLIHQPSYSILNRWIEPDLVETLGELGVGCITFSPLAQGVLTDRYLNGIPEGSRASRNDSLAPETLTEETLAKVQGAERDRRGARPVARPDGARLDAARPADHLDAPRREQRRPARAEPRRARQPRVLGRGARRDRRLRARERRQHLGGIERALGRSGRRWSTAASARATSTSPRSPSAPGSRSAAASSASGQSRASIGPSQLGINFFDTANVYGRGAAEEFLGEVLSTPAARLVRARHQALLPDGRRRPWPVAGADPEADRRVALRLQTDYVDLYQCHRYDRATPLEETMEALTEVVRAGKARYLGFSEWSAGQIEAAHALPGVERFVSSQPQYSLLWRLPERAVIPLSREEGISQIVWSPLGQGVLTGKYQVGAPTPADSRASSDQMGWAMGRFLTDEIFAAVDRLRPIASGAGLSLSQLALAWVLREPNVAAAIVGVSRPEQLDENAGASGVRLDEATLAAIDDALAGVVVDPE